MIQYVKKKILYKLIYEEKYIKKDKSESFTLFDNNQSL